MKKKFLLFIFGVCLALPSMAYDFTSSQGTGGTEYAFDYVTGGVEIAGGYNYEFSGTVTLPTMTVYSDMYYVYGVGAYAFQDAAGESVTIIVPNPSYTGSFYLHEGSFKDFTGLVQVNFNEPSKVTEIGPYTFQGCTGLTNFTFPSGVTAIEAYTFEGCTSLSSFAFGGNVTSIGAYAFQNCTAFKTFDIPATVTTIGAGAFANCSGLTEITCKGSTPPNLGDDVFAGLDCSTITLIIPEGSEDAYKADSQWSKFFTEEGITLKVGDEIADEGSGLNYRIVSLDETTGTVEVYDDNSASGSITIPESFEYSGITFTVVGISDSAFSTGGYRNAITSISMPNTVTYIGYRAFYDCTGISSMNLSTGLESIGEGAFQNCTAWTQTVVIPDAVTEIAASSFRNTRLTSITLGDYVTLIGNAAFQECSGLTSFVLPATVTEIGTNAFLSCSNLTSFTSLNPEPPTLGSAVFDGINANAILYVPCAGKDAYAEAWSGFGTIETVDECGGGEPITFDYTVKPSEGEVSSLRNITISFADGVQLNAGESSRYSEIVWGDAKLYKGSEAVAEVVMYSATGSNPVTAYQFTLGEDGSGMTISDPGEYDFIMPAGYLSFYDTSSGTWVESEEISVHYVISESGGSSEHQYTVTPPEGEVTELSEITFFSPEGFVGHDGDMDYSGTISIYKDGVLYATTTDIESDWDSDIAYDGDCYLYFTLESTITEAGDYQVVIPAGLFCWLNNGGPGSLNEQITLNYTIGESTSGTFTYTVEPADGEPVSQLDKITFYNDYGIYFNEDDENGYDEEPIVVYDSENKQVSEIANITPIEEDKKEIGQEVTFDPVVTEVGDYTVVVPASFFYAYDENGNKSFNDKITLSYSIKETSQGTTGGVPEGYVLDPADGTEVPYLDEIVISLESGNITCGSSFATVVVKDEADKEVTTVTLDDATQEGKVICTLDEKITTAGTYKVTFPEGVLEDWRTVDPNPEFTVTYYVTGEAGTGSNYVIVIDPESGTTHESLNEFSLTCTDGFSLNDFDNPLEVKKDEVVVAHAWYDTPIMDGSLYIGYKFTFSDTSDGPESLTLTDEGTYTIYVPKEYFILGDNVSEYNEEFTITYYLEGGEPTGTYGFTVDPQQGEVESLKEITFTSDEVDGFLGNYEYAEYTQKALVYDRFNRGNPITTATMSNLYNYPDNYDYGILLTLEDEITEPGSYSVVIPEGSFYWVVNDEPILNEEITLSYGVVEPQGEYTFNPADNSTLSSLSDFTVGYEDGIDCSWNYTKDVTVTDEYGEVVAHSDDCEVNWPDSGDDPALSCTITLDATITAKGTYTVTIPEGYFVVGSSYANSKELKITYYIDGSEEGTPLADGTEFNYDGLNYQVVSSEERTVEVVDNASYSGAADIPARFTYSNVTYTVIGIGESAFWDGSNYNGNLTSVVMPSTVTYIGNRGFYHCNKLTSVTLSENLESIGTEAFRGDSGIEGNLVIPDGVTTIENYTFQSCSHLSSITIGNGVTTIGQQAFYECTGATELTVGSSVAEINTQAFGSCAALTKVTSLNPAPPECGSSVFSSVPVSSIPLYVPAGSKDLYQGSGTWQDFYEIIELEGTPTTTFECVVDPEDGKTIDKLECVEFYNPTDGEEIFFNDYAADPIVVTDASGNYVTEIANVYADFGPNYEEYGQIVYFEETVTEPGTYYVEVPAETFYIVDASGNTIYSAAMHLTYTISSDSGDENPNENLTFAPEDGSEVSVLEEISIFCEDGITCVLMPEEEITITDSNNAKWAGTYTITEVAGDSGTITEVVITLTPSIADPGTYYVHVPAGYFQVGQQVNTEFTLTYYVTGVTTGISGFSIADDNVEGIYSTAGQKLNQTQRGVNIIRFSDGSVKKLYVK